MNHSIHSADRATHLKIVIAALTIAIVGSATVLRFNSKPASIETTAVFKAGKPVVLTGSTALIVR